MSQRSADQGFSIVELIIAMFLLAIIAVALVPMLWQGIRFSQEQSDVATATREVNALVEAARDNPTCDKLTALAGNHPYVDAEGDTPFTTAVTVGACASKTSVSVKLSAAGSSGPLASASALVYVP